MAEVACYVASKLQLLNVVNLIETKFSNSIVDLYILDEGRISEEMIDNVKGLLLFHTIYHIKKSITTIPNNYKNKSIRNGRILIGAMIYYISLRKLIINQHYTHIITYSFWMYANLFVINCYQNNHNIIISLIEEGVGSYYLSKNQLCSSFTFKNIINNLPIFRLLRKCIINVDCLYLYETDKYVDNEHLHTKKLGKIINKNLKSFQLLSRLADTPTQLLYNSAKIYFILGIEYTDKKTKTIFEECVNVVANLFKEENIIIKNHPGSLLDSRSLLKCTYDNNDNNIIIDAKNTFLEALFLSVNMTEKILISHSSSTLMYPKYMFNKEPFIIYTYNMYGGSQVSKKICTQYSNDLESSYSNKNRIFTPSTLDEFKDVCIYCKSQLH